MAKRKHKRSGSKSKKVPLLATAGTAAYAMNVYNGYKAGALPGAVYNAIGVNAAGQFVMSQFIKDVTPVAVGVVGSMIASKAGLNRYMSKVPIFKF